MGKKQNGNSSRTIGDEMRKNFYAIELLNNGWGVFHLTSAEAKEHRKKTECQVVLCSNEANAKVLAFLMEKS